MKKKKTSQSTKIKISRGRKKELIADLGNRLARYMTILYGLKQGKTISSALIKSAEKDIEYLEKLMHKINPE